MTQLEMFSAASGVIESPDLWSKRLPAKYSDICPRLVATDAGVTWTASGKIASPPYYLNALDDAHGAHKILTTDDVSWLGSAKGRMWIQDRDSVRGEVLYSTSKLWNLIHNSAEPGFIVDCTRAYNDWLADLCAQHPDRLIGVAKIPTTGVEDATAELKRARESLGLRGAMLDAWPGGADCPPAMRECDSFWEAAAALGMPVSIYRPLDGTHELDPGITAGLHPEYYNNMTTIVYANILDRYPELRFVSVASNAGWAPAVYEQLNDTYMRTAALRKVNLGNPDLYPADYLRRHFWYVTQNDRTALLNRNYFGEAHLIWGSFSFMGPESVWPNTRQLFERLTAGMSSTFRDNLADSNICRLYGLGNAGKFTLAEVTDYVRYNLL
jgi:predicted TIM-barrel fold metal-dependent hydrolase